MFRVFDYLSERPWLKRAMMIVSLICLCLAGCVVLLRATSSLTVSILTLALIHRHSEPWEQVLGNILGFYVFTPFAALPLTAVVLTPVLSRYIYWRWQNNVYWPWRRPRIQPLPSKQTNEQAGIEQVTIQQAYDSLTEQDKNINIVHAWAHSAVHQFLSFAEIALSDGLPKRDHMKVPISNFSEGYRLRYHRLNDVESLENHLTTTKNEWDTFLRNLREALIGHREAFTTAISHIRNTQKHRPTTGKRSIHDWEAEKTNTPESARILQKLGNVVLDVDTVMRRAEAVAEEHISEVRSYLEKVREQSQAQAKHEAELHAAEEAKAKEEKQQELDRQQAHELTVNRQRAEEAEAQKRADHERKRQKDLDEAGARERLAIIQVEGKEALAREQRLADQAARQAEEADKQSEKDHEIQLEKIELMKLREKRLEAEAQAKAAQAAKDAAALARAQENEQFAAILKGLKNDET